MKVTDFLTILGLALAVWALIPKKERHFILLFFSKKQIMIFVLSLVFLHWLFAFDWLLGNWFPFLKIFTHETGIPSSTWAYIFSLVIIVIPVFKVIFGFFSKSRLTELISLYNTLLKDNVIDLLVEYINKYHIIDIKCFLQGLSHLPEKENMDLLLRRRTETDLAYDKLLEQKRMKFAASIYGHILQSEEFVNKTTSKYPELLAIAFSGMETANASNEDLVKSYIELLYESKNQAFVTELRLVNNLNSSIENISEQYEIPILFGLLSNTKAAAKNYVWYPVGEKGIKSLKYDKSQLGFLVKKYDSDLESELWNNKAQIAIVYFNYMVRESIYKNSDWHMWLYYYSYFTDLLINLIPNDNDYEMDAERPSFAHSLIVDIIWNIRGWLNLAKENKVEYRVIDAIRCLGDCLDSICNSENEKLSISFKKRQLDLVISAWFEYSHYDEQTEVQLIREWLIKMFLNPKGVDFGNPNLTENYISLLRDTWVEFDKIPYQMHEDNGSVADFEAKVLIPLNIL